MHRFGSILSLREANINPQRRISADFQEAPTPLSHTFDDQRCSLMAALAIADREA
jgi:hypothetical protein